jgi:hypothetical protein
MNSRVLRTAIVCWQVLTHYQNLIWTFLRPSALSISPHLHHGLGTCGTDEKYVIQSSGQLATCCTQADECNSGPLEMGQQFEDTPLAAAAAAAAAASSYLLEKLKRWLCWQKGHR